MTAGANTPGPAPRLRALAAFAALLLTLIALVASAPDARAQSEEVSQGVWFNSAPLNPLLPPPEYPLDRSTPQGTLEGFLSATARSDFATAAHFLDLSGLPGEAGAEEGETAARRLSAVLSRRVLINWADFPDRPDGVIEGSTSSNPLAGVARRSIPLAVLDLSRRPVTLRINRLKSEDAPPVWLFAPQTVADIHALYNRYGPGWFEDLLPPELLKHTFFDLRRWELIALPTLFVLAAGLFLLLRMAIQKLVRLAPPGLLRHSFASARTPMALFLSAAVLGYVTRDLLTFSAPITTWLSPLLLICVVIAVAVALLRGIDTVLDVITRRYVGEIDDEEGASDRSLYTTIYAVRRIVLLLAVVAGVGVVLMQLHLFETLGMSLLASAGVISIILGIAGQNILGNILASLQVALAKPIRIGDSVEYEGHWAYVEAIFYTFIRLRTWDERRLIVPVQHFISKPFENWSMETARMTRTFTLVLDHEARIEDLRKAFLALAEDDTDVMHDQMLKAMAIDHTEAGVHVRFYCTAKDPTTAWEMHARLREQMIDWVQENHSEWWPRERVAGVGQTRGRSAPGAAGVVGDID